MENKIYSLYQSGERVTVAGVYALVDVPVENNRQMICKLQDGQYFPDHQGRAVCWFLIESSRETPSIEHLRTRNLPYNG
jgi:hypothetical protein